MLKLPADLIQKIQHDYVGKYYQEGVFVFPHLENTAVEQIVFSFISWGKEHGLLTEDKLDISFLDPKK
jgi:hypothetical protein